MCNKQTLRMQIKHSALSISEEQAWKLHSFPANPTRSIPIPSLHWELISYVCIFFDN